MDAYFATQLAESPEFDTSVGRGILLCGISTENGTHNITIGTPIYAIVWSDAGNGAHWISTCSVGGATRNNEVRLYSTYYTVNRNSYTPLSGGVIFGWPNV